MSDIAIRVENLSKLYRIGARQEGYKTLRESITEAALAPFRWWRDGRPDNSKIEFRNSELEDSQSAIHNPQSTGRGSKLGNPQFAIRNPQSEYLWALKDVSFEVKQGEVVGIIGRNGAGKSTLLKILSRITEPTKGRAEIHGRVGSLLEVGTGFHHELTGRENIYLNGAVLGMKKAEIDRKFDEIVAFAEIDQFIDTPVKRYSSGMYVRLAFAVAAYLDPEILLVDEVLAVGDAAFQKKCLGRMRDLTCCGRTVLLVSHNMATILNLCETALILHQGRLVFTGKSKKAIDVYASREGTSSISEVDLANHPSRRPGARPILRSLRFLNSNGVPTGEFFCGEMISIELFADPGNGPTELHFGIVFEDSLGSQLFTVGTHLSDSQLPPTRTPKRVLCRLEQLPLAPGRYWVSLNAGILHEGFLDAIDCAASFDVLEADFYGNGRLPPPVSQTRFLVRSRWEALEARAALTTGTGQSSTPNFPKCS